MTETGGSEMETETRLVVQRGGEYWLADQGLAPTCVTAEQATALSKVDAVDAGACEVRFGGEVGDLLANAADGRWWQIGLDGSAEDVTREMVG